MQLISEVWQYMYFGKKVATTSLWYALNVSQLVGVWGLYYDINESGMYIESVYLIKEIWLTILEYDVSFMKMSWNGNIFRVTGHLLHKGQWRGALMFSLIYVWIKGWVNNREAGDLRRNRAHYDVMVMLFFRSTGLHKILPPHSSPILITICSNDSQTWPMWTYQGYGSTQYRSLHDRL